MKPALLQKAYVLHRRLYRESSLLVEIFTKDHGRVSVIAKGARRPSSNAHGLLQPFLPLIVSWTGKSELKTLTHVELAKAFEGLQGDCLFAGFYLNELITYLLQKWDPHPNLYTIYANTLSSLQAANVLQQKTLRLFEKRLLEEIGYGFKQTFLADKYYRFIPEHGFEEEENAQIGVVDYCFSGRSLLEIIKEDWNEGNLQDAKRLMRLLLTPLLGARQLHSRKLFI